MMWGDFIKTLYPLQRDKLVVFDELSDLLVVVDGQCENLSFLGYVSKLVVGRWPSVLPTRAVFRKILSRFY
jgi:hypothetical protein